MSNQSKLLLLALGILLAGACATPKTPQWKPLGQAELSHPLTLEECLRLARTRDLNVTQWNARIAAARAELTAAKAIPNPTFVGTWEDIGIKDATGASLATQAYGFNYPLFFWWTRPQEIKAAKGKLKAEQAGVNEDRRKLDIDIGTSYFTLAAAARKEKSQEKLMQEAQDAWRLAEESFKLGSVSGHDVALARTEIRQAESELFDARREARAQALAFAFAMGADRPLALAIQETTLTLPAPLAQTATTSATVPESLVRQALQRDPTYVKARATREAAEAELQLQYRKILPLTDAVGTAQSKHAPEGNGATFDFELPLPLFYWNQGGIAKAKAELRTAQAGEEAARRETASSLSEAWESYITAQFRYDHFTRQLTADRAQLARDAQDLFAAGQQTYTDLIQARREWRQSELTAVDSWRESQTAAWKILCELGGGDDQK